MPREPPQWGWGEATLGSAGPEPERPEPSWAGRWTQARPDPRLWAPGGQSPLLSASSSHTSLLSPQQCFGRIGLRKRLEGLRVGG